MRYTIFVVLAAFMILLSCGKNNITTSYPEANKGLIDLREWDFAKDGNLNLQGDWEFYWKKLIEPRELQNSNNYEIKYFKVPGYWNDVAVDSTKLSSIGYATYRLKIISNKNQSLSMYIGEQMTAYKLWCNSNLIHSCDDVSDNKNDSKPSRKPSIIDINLSKDTTELILQISNFHHRLGGIYATPQIGDKKRIYNQTQSKRTYDVLLFSSLLIMGIYFILLFFLRRTLPGTFSLAAFALIMALRTVITGSSIIYLVFPNISWSLLYHLEYLTLFIAPPILATFFYNIFKQEINKIVVSSYFLIGILFSISLFFSPLFFTRLVLIPNLVIIPYGVYLGYKLIMATIRKRYGARTVTISLIIYLLTVLNDFLFIQGKLFWSTELIPLGTFILVFGQVLALTSVFAKLYKDKEKLTSELDYKNKNLDKIVKSKTKELRNQQEDIIFKNKELQHTNEEIISISENLKIQKLQLKRSEMKMTSLIQLLPEAIFEMDKNGDIIYANEEFYNSINLDKDTQLNISEILVNSQSNEKSFIERINKRLETATSIKKLPCNIKRSDDTAFPVLLSIAYDKQINQEIVYRGMFIDISSRICDEQKIKNAFKEIRLKNKDITDSLLYAQKIQATVMPTQNDVKKILKNVFLINKPHSIVSGDFYYIKKNNNKIIFALSDCTGHGVPGGFMTMLGLSLLNELYGADTIPSPEIALEKMREKIIDSLSQEKEYIKNRDGMDIILCILDTETLLLKFASAHQPLLILRDNKLTTVKGESMPVGIHVKTKPFSLKEAQLKKGDSLYLFSDGIVDTFGGEKNHKLYIRGFRSMIESCYTKTMEEQGKDIEDQFMKWKGDNNQIDDVLVMGIKI